MTTINSSYASSVNNYSVRLCVDYSTIPKDLREGLSKLENTYVDRREDLILQMDLSNDPRVRDGLERELHRLDQKFRDLLDVLPESGWNVSFKLGDGPTDREIQFDIAFGELDRFIHSSWERHGIANIGSASCTDTNDASSNAYGGERISMPRPTGYEHLAKGRSAASNADGAIGNYQSMTPADISRAMTTNPEAFWADLGSMSMEERGEIQMKLQMHLQQVNQMLTMMSQLQQAMHETSKSLINNMRV